MKASVTGLTLDSLYFSVLRPNKKIRIEIDSFLNLGV